MKTQNCIKRHFIIPSAIIFVLLSISLIMGCVSTPAKIENSKASLLYQKLIQDNPQSFIEKAYVGAWVTKNSKNEFEIAFIAKNSPAALVDVRVGDIIESIDNLTFRDRAELLRFYDRKEPGDEVNAVIKRNGILINKKVRFGLHHFTNDLYALMKLVATEEPVRLAVVVGDISNVYLQDKTMLDLWTRGMKPILVSNWENTNLQFFKHEPLFSVIDRHKTETLLNELMFQQSGVLKSETQTKLGEILGATHLLVIDFSRFYISSVAVTDVETHKLIEVKSGKVLANALFKTIVQAEKPSDFDTKEMAVVEQDLLHYINERLKGIAHLEKEAIDAYNGVTGSNYRTDASLRTALVNVVIPKYTLFVNGLGSISPATDEVKNIHHIYIRGASIQFEAFNQMVVALNRQDKMLFMNATEKLGQGKEKIDQFSSELKKLVHIYNLELK